MQVTGFPAGETVTIIRPGPPTRDSYGNDIAGVATELDIGGCAVAPAATSEDVQARDQVTQGWTVWMPAGTDVRPTDRVRVRGVEFAVDGSASEWSSPFTGFVGPVQVSVTRVTG